MDSFEAKIEKACKDKVIPGAVLAASSADGRIHYKKAFGVRSLKDNSPMKTDATMFMASCTKLMTTIAALQCVEKGLFSLDDPQHVARILPELKGREILKGFEKGTETPILVPSTKTISLRQLLTHQSGVSYDTFNPTLMRYQKQRGIKPAPGRSRSIPDAYDFPLRFEPGESWDYGVGIDWAGEMVMRVTNMSLEDYMQKHIWGPVGATDITFFPKKSSSVMEKLTDFSKRNCGLTVFGTAEDPNAKLTWTRNNIWTQEPVACHGGAGGFGSPVQYQKILHSICADDGKLLKSETVAMMFEPQLSPQAREKKNKLNEIPEMKRSFGGVEGKVDWGLGGIMNMDAQPGRSAGSISWTGLPNLMWWIDRKAGLSGIIGTQIAPPGDLVVVNLMKEWTEALYTQMSRKEKEKL